MKNIIPALIFILLIGIMVGSVIYLSGRMQTWFDTGRTIWTVVFSLSLVLTMVGLGVFSNTNSYAGSLIYQGAALLMGFLLYFLLTAIAVDILKIFIRIPPLSSGLISLGTTLLVVCFGIWNSFNTRITHITLPIEGLENQVRIAHLTDIHIGHFRSEKTLQKIVDKTNTEKPDIVVITGDLYDGSIRVNSIATAPLKSLAAPVLFVNGNHDGYSGLKSVYDNLNNAGVRILRNEVLDISGIQFIGLNHMRPDSSTRDMHAGEGPNIKDVLSGLNVDKTKATILLHHSPDGAEYAYEAGANLYLAGHTHGGQTFPITLINNLIFKYNKGMYDFKGMKIFVSKGIGTFGPPMRIGSKSEIVIFDLIKK